jgi:nitrate reductase delta subunit
MSETAATAGVRGEAYAVLSELWSSPQDAAPEALRRRAAELLPELAGAAPEAAAALERFIAEPACAEEEYVELFELDPRCPLYLGSHAFDEPTTCARAGVSDRNGYMIELLGLYRHLGLAPTPEELPDYLPLVLEFLALTAGSDDALRGRLVRDYVLPYLPPIGQRLDELATPYRHLLDATERVLRLDAGA